MADRGPQWGGTAALGVLGEAAEHARRTLGVDTASISVWEREHHRLRTLVNAGVLGPGEEPRPSEEVYPVDSFPALARLLDERTPYCFGPGDTVDVASASLAASLDKESQAAVAIAWRGRVWGELWVASVPGGRPLTPGDLPRLVRAANEIARTLDALGAAHD